MNNELQAETGADSTTTDAILSNALLAQNPVLADAVFKPMLFSTPMVQAILEGRKNMTRRIIKAGFDLSNMFYRNTIMHNSKPYDTQAYFSDKRDSGAWLGTKLPINIRDVIWVRETFYAYGNWIKDGTTKTGKQKFKFIDFTKDKFSFEDFSYKYEDCKPQRIVKGVSNKIGWYKRPSLFMTKNACRLFLQIADIKVERLQDISQEDAVNEGIEDTDGYRLYKNYLKEDIFIGGDNAAQKSFKSLWHKINGVKSWVNNPFVWVYTFKVVECPLGFR